LLKFDPAKRISATEILRHPWIVGRRTSLHEDGQGIRSVTDTTYCTAPSDATTAGAGGTLVSNPPTSNNVLDLMRIYKLETIMQRVLTVVHAAVRFRLGALPPMDLTTSGASVRSSPPGAGEHASEGHGPLSHARHQGHGALGSKRTSIPTGSTSNSHTSIRNGTGRDVDSQHELYVVSEDSGAAGMARPTTLKHPHGMPGHSRVSTVSSGGGKAASNLGHRKGSQSSLQHDGGGSARRFGSQAALMGAGRGTSTDAIAHAPPPTAGGRKKSMDYGAAPPLAGLHEAGDTTPTTRTGGGKRRPQSMADERSLHSAASHQS
jgi:hypothetical protein